MRYFPSIKIIFLPTTTNLDICQDCLISTVKVGYQVDARYTNLSKAFSSVCHKLLAQKFSLSGIISCLTECSQNVLVHDSVSCDITVTYGVPQGFYIGPILFILFTNYVTNCFSNSCYRPKVF